MAQAERSLLHIVTWRAQMLVAREDHVGHHLVIGSDPTRADVLLEDDAVAAEHALVEHDGERVWVHTLEGAPAVRINNVAHQRARVHPGDDVRLGNLVLRLRVLHPAVAKRWQQTIAHDDAALPPQLLAPSGEAVANPPARPAHAPEAGTELPIAPDWVLPNLPEPMRRALLAPLPRAASAALQAGAVGADARWGMALLEVGQDLEAYRWVRRGFRAPRPKPPQGRYDAPVTLPSPLRLRLVGPEAAVAHVRTGLPWVLARGGGDADDEQGGIRQNWAHKGRTDVRIHMQRGDILRVQIGTRTWVACLAPLAVRPPPVALRPRWQLGAAIPWAAGTALAFCAAITAAWVLPHGGDWGKSQPPALRPPARWAPVVLAAHRAPEPGAAATQDVWAAPSAGAAGNASAQAATRAPRGISPPGGSRGYRLFGMVLPDPETDPTSAPGAPPVAPERAWLRGTERDWHKVLEALVGGPPWLLDCEAHDVQVSDARLAPERMALWLTAHPEPMLGCWAKTHPPPESARLAMTLVLAADGSVRRVQASSLQSDKSEKNSNSPWVRCLQANRSAFRAPRFLQSGDRADVTAEVAVTLWPWPR